MLEIFNIGSVPMSPRYKSALLSLASLAIGYGWYFASLFADYRAGVHGHQAVHLRVTILAIALVQILGRVVIAGTSSDRYGPMDEREIVFDWRATTIGYYLLLAGSLAAMATLHAGAQAADMANAALLAIIVVECARQGVFLMLHHRAG